ncbi:MAG: hypothetical protein B6I20_04290, partial [Bacteroidetes bacterium 4572_117]
MISPKNRIFLLGSILVLLAFTSGVRTLDDVKEARGLNDADVISAVKTFMPRGGRDEYFSFVGTGNSGTMVVYGIPSMRIYKYVGVFSPEPWQGYGYDDESMLLLKKGSLDNRIYGYGDMRYPAFSETKGAYNGKYLFYSDGANSRVALLGLDDFETKQVLSNALFVNCFPGVTVTQNTEYIVQSSQYPALWENKTADVETEFDAKFKSGVTFWKFQDTESEIESGHHQGRIVTEGTFTLELPPFTLDYFDAGKNDSHGLLVGAANKAGKHYVYVVDYTKLEGASDKVVNEFSVVSTAAAVGANGIAFIEVPSSISKVKVSPDGNYFIAVGDETFVLDFAKTKEALANKTFAGNTDASIPLIDFAAVKHSSLKVGTGVVDLAFDGRENVAYTSAFDDKKVIKWNFDSGEKLGEITLSFKPGQLMIPQGNTVNPHSNYLTVVNKEGLYENIPNVGPTRPSYQHLIDISSDDMKDIYTMSIPQANVYGSVAVLRTTIKPI